MNKTKGFLRIGIVLSVLWLFVMAFEHSMWQRGGILGNNLDDFVAQGVLPLVIFWGLVWAIAGFRNKDDETEDAEDDKQDE